MGRSGGDAAIKKHFQEKMSARIKNLVAAAKWDLHQGPLSKRDARDLGFKTRWPGYSKAIDEISAWADEHVGEVWYDTQSGYVDDREPQGFQDGDEWVEPAMEDFVHYERRDVMRALFGDLVTDGGLR